LRSALTRLAGLQVVGRTSSEAVRNDDAQTAAKKLGVANILTGSVRQSQSTIRVGAQLIDGRNGMERWSDTYDRPPGDSIQIQTDIAENVARALRVTLGGGEQGALAVAGTANAEAQKLVFQANQLSYAASTRSAMDHAIGLIDAALKLDPKYAYAYALKAILILVKVNGHARGSEELSQGRAEARKLAQAALRLDPELPIGHGALAELYRSDLQLRPAYGAYKRVFQLTSGDPDALRSYARFLSSVGDQSQALQLAKQAVVLDPLNSGSYGVRARVLYDMRRYGEVVRLAEELKRNLPALFNHPLTLGNSLMMLGRTGEARRQYAESPDDDPIRMAAEAVLAARTRNKTAALQKMARVQRLYGDAASYQYAQIHAQLGDRDQAFAALERGLQIKDGGMLAVRVDPWLDPLRSDRRFTALVKRMNFPA
jgi:tetratricopeptide (TPR) repeat protein